MEEPPQDDLICPCCGIHFGYDDFAVSHAELRSAWLDKGAHWFSRHTPMPSDWSPVNQLHNLTSESTNEDWLKTSTRATTLTAAGKDAH